MYTPQFWMATNLPESSYFVVPRDLIYFRLPFTTRRSQSAEGTADWYPSAVPAQCAPHSTVMRSTARFHYHVSAVASAVANITCVVHR